ncbi:enoyl-CoA hydratase/isomerase family protein [Parapedobacter koreensis]|uniref:Methylglutaconyl-CoA hydratase n=1 Tax=Parapedobacter koreensis TaxID=332977 RepID=A0A1H7MY82_9SPHI|nr:enoyl-CoA hydratase/isomerase family protein [Parapedobacter koreensis]SEL15708.1 methylglutaconyl-CoA hydratase [Parapedobacter koreensis]
MGTVMGAGFVKTEMYTPGLAAITFDHPVHNSLPSALLTQLCDQIQAASANEATRLILLQSGGNGTFCAGASFDELLALADQQAGIAFFARVADVINAIRKSAKLIIGRVQGKAVGGGVGIIAACDYCFAVEKAAVKLSEISINIGPFVIAPALIRKIGTSAFTVLSLNPTLFFDAQWAQQCGLFHAVQPTVSKLDEAIHQFCSALLDKNQEALMALKQTLWYDTDHWDKFLYEQAAISGRLALSPETKQLLSAIKKGNQHEK